MMRPRPRNGYIRIPREIQTVASDLDALRRSAFLTVTRHALSVLGLETHAITSETSRLLAPAAE